MQRWKIGNVTVTRIVESEGAYPGPFILKDAVPDAVKREAWLRPHFADDAGMLRMAIHALVIETGDVRVLVDTCVGNDKDRAMVPAWNQLHGPFLSDLAAAGFPRESIDFVLCTHLHVDHVGWNTMWVDGRWVPTFPRSRYLIGRQEWEHWSHFEGKDLRDPIEDSVRPVIDAGLADLVEPDHRLNDEVWLEPTPGHTPGHASVRISSDGAEAIITGDLMHHPIQCANPRWASTFDTDPELARQTRRAFLDRYADRPVLVLGTHFATPTAGHVVRHGDVWRFVVEG